MRFIKRWMALVAVELEPLLTDADDTVSVLSAVPAALGTLCRVIIVAFVAVSELEPLLTDADTGGQRP